MIIHRNNEPYDSWQALYEGKNIIIAIDSSKSNTGMIVGTPDGFILDDFEIDGAGSLVDVYDLCADTRKFLKTIFRNARIRFIGIEDIITKAEKNSKGAVYKGMEIHKSRAAITAVFNNFIFSFEEFYNIRPTPINNWAWKSDILPEEYRTREHDKGSKDYFNDVGGRWAGRKDDVTDAVCIFYHILRTFKISVVEELREIIPPTSPYQYMIVPESFPITSAAKEFSINIEAPFNQIVASISAKLSDGRMGYFKTPIGSIPLEDIYSEHLVVTKTARFSRTTRTATVLVRRKE